MENTLAKRVCLHVVRPACTDVRAMRAASALSAAGYTVTIIDVQDGSEPSHRTESIAFKHICLPDWRALAGFSLLVKALKIFLLGLCYLWQSGADIYHASEVTALPACFLVAKLRRKPLIYEAYELPLCDVPLAEMDLGRRCFHALLTLLLALMLPRCAAVIAVSPPIVAEIRRRYHPPRTVLIRNLPVYKTVARSDRLHRYLGLPSSTRVVLYQGNLQPDRGLDRLVRAARFLAPDSVLVMMGKPVGAMQARLEALIASEGVAERVSIIPPVPYDELLSWTASADLGLVLTPLDYTLNMRLSLPNKFFEYLMAGLPVLASPLVAVEEVLKCYDVGVIVPSLTPEAIGTAITTLLADHIALACMRCNALSAARDLCWDNERQHLITLYNEVAREAD